MTDLIQRIEARVSAWLKRRQENRLRHRFGGIQRCPWCKQCAQTGEGWHFDSDTDPTIDALHCGVCGGVSRWRFEMGMIQLDPPGLTPPPVKTPAALRASQGGRGMSLRFYQFATAFGAGVCFVGTVALLQRSDPWTPFLACAYVALLLMNFASDTP